jgi:hypothetical protein
MNRFDNVEIAPSVDMVQASAMHIPPRDDAGSAKCAFTPGLTAKASASAIVRVLLQTVTTQEVAHAAAFDSPEMRDDQQLLLDQGFDRAQRVASGRVEAEDIAWLSKGFSAFLAAGGVLSLERCLGLPRNDCALRRACRDYWLRRAWKALGGPLSPWRRSEKLAATVRDFQSRQWVRWRALTEAPTLASEVEVALFQAFRSSERVPHTAMQLHNIANHRQHS